MHCRKFGIFYYDKYFFLYKISITTDIFKAHLQYSQVNLLKYHVVIFKQEGQTDTISTTSISIFKSCNFEEIKHHFLLIFQELDEYIL